MADQKESGFMIAMKDIIAGSFGGVLQCLVGHPLDTVKVILSPFNYQGPSSNSSHKRTSEVQWNIRLL